MSRTCLCRTYRSVTRIAEENGLWLVPPIRYLGGWETHRVITDAKAALDRFVKGVQEVGRLEPVDEVAGRRHEGAALAAADVRAVHDKDDEPPSGGPGVRAPGRGAGLG